MSSQNGGVKVKRIFQGFLIGAATLVPGVSGGSMAIILSVYPELLELMTSFHHQWKQNVYKVIYYGMGVVSSFILIAPMMVRLLQREPVLMGYLFMGVIAGGLPTIWSRSKPTRVKFLHVLAVIVGFLMVYVMSQTPSVSLMVQMNRQSYSMMIVIGLCLACALVLPGLSASFLLYVLGVYEFTLQAVMTCDLALIIPLGIGVVIGAILSAKCIRYVMQTYERMSYLVVLGMMVASIVVIFPGRLANDELLFGILLVGSGFLLTRKMSN